MADMVIGTASTPGEKGERGTRWFDGHGPPVQVPDAKEGDYYLDVDSGQIYKLKWS